MDLFLDDVLLHSVVLLLAFASVGVRHSLLVLHEARKSAGTPGAPFTRRSIRLGNHLLLRNVSPDAGLRYSTQLTGEIAAAPPETSARPRKVADSRFRCGGNAGRSQKRLSRLARPWPEKVERLFPEGRIV